MHRVIKPAILRTDITPTPNTSQMIVAIKCIRSEKTLKSINYFPFFIPSNGLCFMFVLDINYMHYPMNLLTYIRVYIISFEYIRINVYVSI